MNKKKFFIGFSAVVFLIIFSLFIRVFYIAWKVRKDGGVELFGSSDNSGPLPGVPEEFRSFALHKEIKGFEHDSMGRAFKEHFKKTKDSEKTAASTENNLSIGDKIKEFKKALPEGLLERVEQTMPGLARQMTKNLPPLPEVSQDTSMYSKVPKYSELRDFSRNCTSIAEVFAFEKKYEAALSCLAAVYLSTYHAEISSDYFSITHMMAKACRGIALDGLNRILPSLDIPAERLKEWSKFFYDFAEKIPSLKSIISADKISTANIYNKKYMDKEFLKKNRISRNVLKVGSSKENIDKHINAFYDYILEIYDKPPCEFIALFEKHADNFVKEGLYHKVRNGGFKEFSLGEIIYYFVFPYEYLYLLQVRMAIPDISRLCREHMHDVRRTRGSGMSLALKGYERQYGRMPASLSELEKWVGFKFAPDPVTGEPFKYTP